MFKRIVHLKDPKKKKQVLDFLRRIEEVEITDDKQDSKIGISIYWNSDSIIDYIKKLDGVDSVVKPESSDT